MTVLDVVASACPRLVGSIDFRGESGVRGPHREESPEWQECLPSVKSVHDRTMCLHACVSERGNFPRRGSPGTIYVRGAGRFLRWRTAARHGLVVDNPLHDWVVERGRSCLCTGNQASRVGAGILMERSAGSSIAAFPCATLAITLNQPRNGTQFEDVNFREPVLWPATHVQVDAFGYLLIQRAPQLLAWSPRPHMMPN